MMSNKADSPVTGSTQSPVGHAPLVLLFGALTFAVLGLIVGSVRFGLAVALVLLIVSFATHLAERRGLR